MRKFILLSAVVMFFGITVDTFGQRRGNDRERIRSGVRSGQITRDEARQIRERERQIRAERRGYRSDGVITREERREIRKDEREQDRYIRSQRRDSDRRTVYNNGRYQQRRGYGYGNDSRYGTYGGYGSNGRYGTYGGYNNQNQIELNRGYQQGLETGASDGQRGQSYSPQRSRHYKNASTQAFLDGFVRGYDEGYRQYAGYDNGGYRRSNSGGLGAILGGILGRP
jgi:hypothetical protein